MLKYVIEYRGVVLFYILLIVVFFGVSYTNRLADMQAANNTNSVMTNN